ncbi:hypothetical protein HPB50_024171 [Hyalomma asiaticum]|uniref:Uncharacterized protein n=1 Tax=Hyalomma asiaticum TaxID=266040 RepID=A0ACB7SHG4_HYAAI|nr:hypothetical protein HPB50_024171 [Hyalomma asiaticum]
MPANAQARDDIAINKNGPRTSPAKASLAGADAQRGADAKPRDLAHHTVPENKTGTFELMQASAEVTAAERVRQQGRSCPMPLMALVPCWAGSLCVGTALGYSLPAGRSLHHAKDSGAFDITHAQIFWFGSLMALGAVFGCLGGAILTQRFGRRWSFATSALGLLATWLCIGLGHDVYLFFVARFLNGFFTGFVSLVVPAHIAEMSLVAHRGTDGATHHLVITLGMLYAHTAGHFLDWSWLALCCAPPALLLLLLTAGLLVESPRWLLYHHRRHRALEALLSVRTAEYEAAAEVEFEAISAIFPNYKTPPAHYMLAVLVMGAQQLSGINCVLLSATNLVPRQDSMNSLTVLSLIQSLVASLAVPFLDLAGRRKLLILSTVVCSGSLVTLGLIYYPSQPAVTSGVEPTTPGASQAVVPVATASTTHHSSPVTFAVQTFLVAGYSAGLGPVSWILAVELTPLRNSGMELGSVYAASWAALFVSANYFSTSSTMHWLAVTLWVYSCFTLTSGVLFLALLPETAQASIEDVLLMGQEVKPQNKDMRRRSKVHGQASKQDGPHAPQPAQQPANVAAAAPSGHPGAKGAPPQAQRPAVATGSSSGTSRQSVTSRASGARRRAHGVSALKPPIWAARLLWRRCTKDEAPHSGSTRANATLRP